MEEKMSEVKEMLGFDSPAAAGGTVTIGGELTVNRLGFGAMRLTGAGTFPEGKEEAITLLRRVAASGINLIDTADAYGPNIDEELIAEALHPYPNGMVIATKGGSTQGGPEQWGADGHPRYLRQACEGSLKRLRLACIDLYQLHTVDPRIPIEESVGALAQLQVEGKIRYIGLSNVSVVQLERARGVTDIASVQNRYNLGDRSSDDVLRRCEQLGIPFIPWFPLAMGALAHAGGIVASVAAKHQATPAQVAIAWLLYRSPIMTPIPGTSSIEHFEENLGGASLTLTPDEYTEITRSR
jgi:pyridoxine 4-dehydrogenase